MGVETFLDEERVTRHSKAEDEIDDAGEGKAGERRRIVPAHQNQQCRDQEINHEGQRRETVDGAGDRRRAISQAANDECRAERVPHDRVEDMCADRLDRITVRSRQRP